VIIKNEFWVKGKFKDKNGEQTRKGNIHGMTMKYSNPEQGKSKKNEFNPNTQKRRDNSRLSSI
jgi:hypothetical protein